MKFISAIVGCHNVHKKYVFRLFIEARNAHFEGRKHASATHRIEYRTLATFVQFRVDATRTRDYLLIKGQIYTESSIEMVIDQCFKKITIQIMILYKF